MKAPRKLLCSLWMQMSTAMAVMTPKSNPVWFSFTKYHTLLQHCCWAKASADNSVQACHGSARDATSAPSLQQHVSPKMKGRGKKKKKRNTTTTTVQRLCVHILWPWDWLLYWRLGDSSKLTASKHWNLNGSQFLDYCFLSEMLLSKLWLLLIFQCLPSTHKSSYII